MKTATINDDDHKPQQLRVSNNNNNNNSNGTMAMTSSSWAASIVASYNNGSDNDSILLTNSAPSNEKHTSHSLSESRSTSTTTTIVSETTTNKQPPQAPTMSTGQYDNGKQETKGEMQQQQQQQQPQQQQQRQKQQQRIIIPPPSPPPHGYDELSSSKSSPFRQSLDEEAKLREKQRQPHHHLHTPPTAPTTTTVSASKQLLRDSIASLSSRVDDYGQSVLTRPERTFLELLLENNGPDAAEACMAAHRRLMDGNLFWAMCGGSAGEVGSGLIPGHGWNVEDSYSGTSFVKLKEGGPETTTTATNGSGGGSGGSDGDWMQNWVAMGSQSSNDSNGVKKKKSAGEGDATAAAAAATTAIAANGPPQHQRHGLKLLEVVQATEHGPTPKVTNSKKNLTSLNNDQQQQQQQQHRPQQHSSSIASLSSSTKELIRPYELERHSSEARITRLEMRRRQSSMGTDNTSRLFRAHEAGLVVTPHGSARRSLMRMGLPMEKGLYNAPSHPHPQSQSQPQPPALVPIVAPMPPEEIEKEIMMEKRELLHASPSLQLKKEADDAEDDKAVVIINNNNNNEQYNPKNTTTKILTGNTTMEQQVHPTTFEKALAKMDERTIRRIEKEERAKRRHAQEAEGEAEAEEDRMTSVSGMKSPLMMGGAGCGGGGISPFSMSILRKMFASKQFSFHRSSSSYTRFDSFLTSQTSESGGGGGGSGGGGGVVRSSSGVTMSSGGAMSDSTGLNSVEKKEMQKDIFRRRRRTSSTAEDHLKNLLINAGFRNTDEEEDEEIQQLVVDAKTEDDVDILSSSQNSVAMLLQQGGPSYRDASMFRGVEDSDDFEKEDRIPTEIPVRKKKSTKSSYKNRGPDVNVSSDLKKVNLAVQTTGGSMVSALGSGSPPRRGNVDDAVKKSPVDEAKVSPTNSDLGELPTLPTFPQGVSTSSQSSRSSRSATHKRSTTIGVLKSSSHSINTSPSRNGRDKYKRSVSWGHMVFSKDEVRSSVASIMSRQDSTSTAGGTLSVISFPHLARAAPLRSDSIGSNASTMLSYPPPLKMGAPLRSDSISSVASILSPIPSLSRAHPVWSPRPSFASSPATSSHMMLARAHSIRSESQQTVTTVGGAMDDDFSDEGSLNSEDYVDAKPAAQGAVWESPLVSRGKKSTKPPLHGRGFSISTTATEGDGEEQAHPKMYIRQASENNYDGIGIEIEEFLPEVETIDNARKHRSLMSVASEYSVGGLSRSQSRNLDGSHLRRLSMSSSRGIVIPPMTQTLDDSFIIKNINFERHSSEILRSLSNEDLYSSHHLQTINGASSRGGKNINELSSVARVIGDPLTADSSWDFDSNSSLNLAYEPSGGIPAPGVNAWGVLDDEYAEGYGAHDTLPFRILGTSAHDTHCHPHVLSPPLMESLQNFMPPTISETNFWLKYSLVRDGASLPSLLRHIRGTKHALIAIETVEGEVFGSFTSSPWRKNWNYYGNGESFLWRMRRTRSEKDIQYSVLDQAKLESELDVFYWSGRNDLVQYCTQDMLAVGGGSMLDGEDTKDDMADNEQRELPPTNPVFSKAADKGGFGLAIDSELLRGTSAPCATFHSPPLSSVHSNGSPFEILNIEVWTMTPFGNVAEAENMEMKTLFLEAYSNKDFDTA